MDDATNNHESFGVLVGWAHHGSAGRLNLTLQCVQSTRRDDARAIDDHHIVMTPSQAAVLANYLFQISGQAPPEPRPSLLRRLFG
jgi:BarA-like signal transduction histidine kinase